MKQSLRARLLVIPAVAVIAIVAVFSTVEFVGQRRWLIQRESELLRRTTLEAARHLAPRPEGWQAEVDSLDARLGLRVTVLASDGGVIADSRVAAASMENHASRPEFVEAVAGRVGIAVRRSVTTGDEYLYCAVAITSREGARVLRLAEPLELMRHLSDSLSRTTAASASVALLVSVLVLAYVSGRFARRLQRLQRVARRIGEGDSGARAPETPNDALGQLGQALNHMHTELDTRLEALRRERDDRERILAHMSDGVALVDADGRIVHVNHRLAELLDVALRPEPGTAFTAFTRVPELADMVREARAEARTLERELRPWTTSTKSARATATPLGGGAVLLVLHDLSESEGLQRMRQDFVANVSHELRTPLTSLRGYAETLLEGGLDDVENRETFVRVIRDQSVQLQLLVEDLLSLAEMERPDATLRWEPLDLRALAAEQVGGLRDAATRAGLLLELTPGDAVPVPGDRVRLSQVLANLVDNAIKYTEHGSVRVALGQSAGRAWCEVRDTGAGIPAEDLPRIFERFYRVDKARSRGKGGTGLGLSIVKHAIALHDGVVAVESRVGEGTVFRFEIPATRPS